MAVRKKRRWGDEKENLFVMIHRRGSEGDLCGNFDGLQGGEIEIRVNKEVVAGNGRQLRAQISHVDTAIVGIVVGFSRGRSASLKQSSNPFHERSSTTHLYQHIDFYHFTLSLIAFDSMPHSLYAFLLLSSTSTPPNKTKPNPFLFTNFFPYLCYVF